MIKYYFIWSQKLVFHCFLNTLSWLLVDSAGGSELFFNCFFAFIASSFVIYIFQPLRPSDVNLSSICASHGLVFGFGFFFPPGLKIWKFKIWPTRDSNWRSLGYRRHNHSATSVLFKDWRKQSFKLNPTPGSQSKHEPGVKNDYSNFLHYKT